MLPNRFHFYVYEGLHLYIYVPCTGPLMELEFCCEPPCGYWESNPGPLQEQVLVTVEPPLQPLFIFI